MDQADHALQMAGPLTDYYTLESHLLSTRTADACRAVDRHRGVGVVVWMLRHPLARSSAAVRRFLDRIEKIRALVPPVCAPLRFGVDSAGTAFLVLPSLDGHPITSGNVELNEAERRFISCLKVVDRLHTAGVVCGDLCGSSFWVDRGGELRFIGVMGAFDSEATGTAVLPPMETLRFMSPEQRSGGGVEPASDVFSLGVLGYFLLTGRYPFGDGAAALVSAGDLAPVQPLSDFLSVPPVWAQQVLDRCLLPNPSERYGSAGEILRDIGAIRERSSSGMSAPVRVRRDSGQTRQAQRGPVAQAHPRNERPPPRPAGNRPRRHLVPLAIALVILSAVATVAGVLLRAPVEGSVPGLRKELAVHRDVVQNDQLRDAIDVIGESDSALAERAAQLDRIVGSDDPIAHDVLVTSAKEAGTQQLRALSEKAVIDRARRLGLMRSSEQVRQWLRSLQSGEIPSIYDAVLRSLDTSLPMDARAAFLRQGYASNPRLVLRLTAALALDTGRLEEYQPILAQLIADAVKMEDAGAHSTLGLILADAELAMMFGDDVIQRRDALPEGDVMWLLRILAERNDVNVRAIANLALERNIVPPAEGTFLTLVRDRTDLAPDLLTALIRSAARVPRIQDIGAYGRWYDVDAERVLLATAAQGGDTALLHEVFDTLAGKSLTVQPSAAMVEWVRRNHWEQRAEFVQTIGKLAFLEGRSPEELADMLAGLDRYAREPAFIDLLLDSRDPRLARLVVERYADRLGVGGLLNLLGSEDRGVRISALRALKGSNDIAALKFIIDAYERERDPEVREVFKESFWVIRERDGGASR